MGELLYFFEYTLKGFNGFMWWLWWFMCGFACLGKVGEIKDRHEQELANKRFQSMAEKSENVGEAAEAKVKEEQQHNYFVDPVAQANNNVNQVMAGQVAMGQNTGLQTVRQDMNNTGQGGGLFNNAAPVTANTSSISGGNEVVFFGVPDANQNVQGNMPNNNVNNMPGNIPNNNQGVM